MTENTNPCEVKHNIYIMNYAAAVVTQTARFCGHVESSNPKQKHTPRCSICKYLNHTTQEYRWKLKCGYCSIMGHAERECRKKKRAKYKQMQEETYTAINKSSTDAQGTQGNTKSQSQ